VHLENAGLVFSSLNWDSAISSSMAGLFFGAHREKTGTLVAPGLGHGLPDAVGEALINIVGWMWKPNLH
jgi:hypothetical protein